MLSRDYISPISNQCKYRKRIFVQSAYSAGREDIQNGDKIVIPQSMYNELIHSNFSSFPIILGILNDSSEGFKYTYCSFRDFKTEGCVIVPTWMFETLMLQEGQTVQIFYEQKINDLNKNDSNIIKLRAQGKDFINFDKKFIENNLRDYCCLHKGDTILMSADNGKWKVDVLDISPKNQFEAIILNDSYVYFQFVQPQEQLPQNVKQRKRLKKRQYFKGVGRRIGGKYLRINQRQERREQNQFDPRQHRLIRGIRKNKALYSLSKGTKIGSYTILL